MLRAALRFVLALIEELTMESPKPAPPDAEKLVRVRFLKPNITVGTRVHATGDVAEVPESRAKRMFEYAEAAYADPGMRTPTPEEAQLDRQIEEGNVNPSDPRLLARQVRQLLSPPHQRQGPPP